MILVNPKKDYPYILEEHRTLPKDKQPVWQVHCIDVMEEEQIRDARYQDLRVARSVSPGKTPDEFQWSPREAEEERRYLRGGLSRVDNLKSDEGETLQCPGPKGTIDQWREFLIWLPENWRSELKRVIQSRSFLPDPNEIAGSTKTTSAPTTITSI